MEESKQLTIFDVMAPEAPGDEEFHIAQLKANIQSDVRQLQQKIGEIETKKWVDSVQ